MPKDPVSRVLLAVIAAGLWGLLLRPLLFAPSPARANEPLPPVQATGQYTVLYDSNNGRYIVLHNSKLTLWTITNRAGSARLEKNDEKALP